MDRLYTKTKFPPLKPGLFWELDRYSNLSPVILNAFFRNGMAGLVYEKSSDGIYICQSTAPNKDKASGQNYASKCGLILNIVNKG